MSTLKQQFNTYIITFHPPQGLIDRPQSERSKEYNRGLLSENTKRKTDNVARFIRRNRLSNDVKELRTGDSLTLVRCTSDVIDKIINLPSVNNAWRVINIEKGQADIVNVAPIPGLRFKK